MKTVYRFLVAAPLIIFLAACEDVVQIKLDEGSKLYVIDAFITDSRTPQKIRVVTNDSYFSNREAPPVATAQVSLIDLTDNKQYAFTYSTNGYYVYPTSINDTLAKINHQYLLNITIDGFTYTSLTTQKRGASIDSIVTAFNDGTNGGFGPPQKPYYMCGLFAKDKTDNNSDYYWIKTFRNDTLFSEPSDINISIDGTNGPVTDTPVDSTAFTPPITFLGFKRYNKNDICKVEIHSIARDTYYFFVQAQAQINNGGLFATTPENVKTNLITPKDAKTKAVGWFNMATVVTQSIIVQ